MDVILHIGMPKTGTTALQVSLANSRGPLAEHGVLYPVLSSLGHAHHLLMPLFLPPEAVWGRVTDHFGADPAAGALAEWRSVLAQARRRRPRAVVLSTEALFTPFEPERLAAFAGHLRELGDNFTVVAYVREPVAFYRAVILERAKRTLRLRPTKPVPYRAPIEQLCDALGARAVVRPFSRAGLHKGDIASDFALHALGAEVEGMASVQSNVSLAPETAAMFQSYMAAKTGLDVWPVREAESRLVTDLRRIEDEVARAGGRPATPLRPAVAERMTYASKDLLWLRDEFGIGFEGVDYARLRDRLSPRRVRIQGLGSAFELDQTFYRRVLDAAAARHPEIGRLLSEPAA